MPYATCTDVDSLQRFALASPAYGCYPAPEYFQPNNDSSDYLQHLRSTRQTLAPLSLYVHLPFCASACYHCARASVIAPEPHNIARYLDALTQEAALISRHLDKRQLVERLHIGGGTPALLNLNQLRHLLNTLHKHFMLLDNAGDYSIELDPRIADWSMVGILRELGFNRVQIRVQELGNTVQSAANRYPTLRQVRTLVEAARTLQFANVGIDLIVGLPLQTTESLTYTLERMIALQPDQIVLKTYQHTPARHPIQHNIASDTLPNQQTAWTLYQHCVTLLQNAGYLELGLGHFAQAHDELLLAQDDGELRFDLNGFSSHSAEQLIGLGLGAISHVAGLSTRNSQSLDDYQHALLQKQLPIREQLLNTLDDRLRAYVIEQITCHKELHFSELQSKFGIQFHAYFSAIHQPLQALADADLLSYRAQGLKLQEHSTGVLIHLCKLFDQYLA